MIHEAYVSFEIAKLLKEKGFDEPCYMSYWLRTKDNIELAHLEQHCNNYSDCMCAPTLQMTCAWLREVHNIDIIIFHEKLPNDCYWARIERNLCTEFEQEPEYNSYEEAAEAAIEYSLENLI